MTTPLTELVRRWLRCFDDKDVDTLISLYAEDAKHSSPKLRILRPETGGAISGRMELRDWWADAFKRLPDLRYVETRITENGTRAFLEYMRHVPNEPDMPIAEVFETRDGLIVESRVYHG